MNRDYGIIFITIFKVIITISVMIIGAFVGAFLGAFKAPFYIGMFDGGSTIVEPKPKEELTKDKI